MITRGSSGTESHLSTSGHVCDPMWTNGTPSPSNVACSLDSRWAPVDERYSVPDPDERRVRPALPGLGARGPLHAVRAVPVAGLGVRVGGARVIVGARAVRAGGEPGDRAHLDVDDRGGGRRQRQRAPAGG